MSISARRGLIGGVHVLTVTGEVDFAIDDGFEAAISDAVPTPPEALVVDLRGLEYIGSNGLGCLIRAHKKMLERRSHFAIVVAPGIVRRIVEIANLDEVLHVYGDLDAALAAAQHAGENSG